MKTKKIWKTLLAFLLSIAAAFACFGMSACQGNDGGSTNNGESNGDNTGGNNTGGNGNTDGEGDNEGNGNTDGEGDNEGDGNTDGEIDSSEKFTGKIYVVGDSTVCSFTDNYYLPRYGYGTQLYNYINVDEANIVNLALSGRSSLSFISEENYTTLKNSISEGDYLIIGFGHNDEKSEDPERYTDPTKTHTDSSTENGPSFRYTLYENYVKMAKDKGATPILCTPIVRYNADSEKYDAASGHITDKGNYPEAIKTLGAATETTVIDLTAITKAEYIELKTEALNYHAFTSYNEEGGVKVPVGEDTTHLNYYGAKNVAYELAEAIKKSDCTLKKHIKTNNSKPTKADYAAAINADFVKSAYTQFDPSAYEEKNLGNVSGANWYSTVMGDVGGSDKIANFSVSQDNGKFTVGNSSNNGKFAGSSYGFGAAFIQIDANKNFTASATVKVTEMTTSANNQTGFGMMIRDDIYVDKSDATIKSDCLMAGAVVSKGAIFSYVNGKMANPKNPVTVEKGSSYNVSVTKTANSFKVTFSDGANSYSETYPDFNVEATDTDYVYLCLFANRGITVEFTDVSFEITGESQGA